MYELICNIIWNANIHVGYGIILWKCKGLCDLLNSYEME